MQIKGWKVHRNTRYTGRPHEIVMAWEPTFRRGGYPFVKIIRVRPQDHRYEMLVDLPKGGSAFYGATYTRKDAEMQAVSWMRKHPYG